MGYIRAAYCQAVSITIAPATARIRKLRQGFTFWARTCVSHPRPIRRNDFSVFAVSSRDRIISGYFRRDVEKSARICKFVRKAVLVNDEREAGGRAGGERRCAR